MIKHSERYQNILESIKMLKLEELLSLLADIVGLLRNSFNPGPKHKITELEGLGAEIWQKVEIEKYIEQERASWD